MKKISIITATFNAESCLPLLINSLKNQIDKDFEWIVVDGGSSDSTITILQSAGDVLTHYVSQPDFGIYDALNKALKLTTGDYYIVVGADDSLYPDAVSNFRSEIALNDYDLILASIDTDNGVLKHKVRPFLGTVFHHSVGCMIKKSLHLDFGYYSNRFPIAADQFFLNKAMYSHALKIKCASFVSGFYSIKGTSNQDIVGVLTEFYRIQIETRGAPVMQTLLLIVRLLWHLPKIIVHSRPSLNKDR